MGEKIKESPQPRLLLQKDLLAVCRIYAAESRRSLRGQIEFNINSTLTAFEHLRYARPTYPGNLQGQHRADWEGWKVNAEFMKLLHLTASREGFSDDVFARELFAIACSILATLDPKVRSIISEEGLAMLIIKRYETLAHKIKLIIETSTLVSA